MQIARQCRVDDRFMASRRYNYRAEIGWVLGHCLLQVGITLAWMQTESFLRHWQGGTVDIDSGDHFDQALVDVRRQRDFAPLATHRAQAYLDHSASH